MVERDNRTVVKCAPSMLPYRSLPLEFLGKVVNNVVYSMCSIEFPTGLCMARHLVPSGTGSNLISTISRKSEVCVGAIFLSRLIGSLTAKLKGASSLDISQPPKPVVYGPFANARLLSLAMSILMRKLLPDE